MLTLLQTTLQPEQLNATVNQLTESSVRLAEAAANFGALKVIFGVFVIFILIILIVFFWQLLSSQKRIREIHLSTKKVEKFFEDTSNRTLGEGQSIILIRRTFNSLAQIIKYNILRARIENHLDREDVIKDKVKRIIDNEYSEIKAFLATFECDGKSLDLYFREEDSQLITDFVLEQVYLDKEIFSISSMDQATEIILNGLKLETLRSISQ